MGKGGKSDVQTAHGQADMQDVLELEKAEKAIYNNETHPNACLQRLSPVLVPLF